MSTVHTDPLRPPRPGRHHEPGGEGDAHFASLGGAFLQWTGVLGPAIVWTVQLLIGYAISRFSHEHRWLTVVHHLVSLVGTLAALACAGVAWHEWRLIGGGEPRGSEPGVPGRSRFLAALGILSGLFFAVVIVAQWVPTFFLDPGWY
jgi:hypothetical protein